MSDRESHIPAALQGVEEKEPKEAITELVQRMNKNDALRKSIRTTNIPIDKRSVSSKSGNVTLIHFGDHIGQPDDRTLTLRAIDVEESGRSYIIKDAFGDAATNNITIDTELTEKIDGANTVVISSNFGFVRIYSDGDNWFTW